jgi:hypothetical protein
VETPPQYHDPDRAEKLARNGEIIFSTSTIVTLIGFGLVLPRAFDLNYIPIPDDVETFGVIALLGGFVFIAAGISLMILGNLLSKADVESYMSYLGN